MVNNFKMNILNGVFFPNYGMTNEIWKRLAKYHMKYFFLVYKFIMIHVTITKYLWMYVRSYQDKANRKMIELANEKLL